MIIATLLAALGVMLFLLPAGPGRLLGAALYILCLASTAPRARLSWIAFGASTIVIGGAIYGFTIPGEDPIRMGTIEFSVEGATIGAADMVRVLGLFSLGLLASRWVPADDLLPFVSRHPFPLYVTASLLRLVPSIRDDYERIRFIQTARGLEPGRLVTRPIRMLPILVPLFINALRRAREQALALELAGLGRRR